MGTGRPRAVWVVALAVAALTGLAACDAGAEDRDDPSSHEGTNSSSPGGEQTIAAGLDAPWSVAFHDGTPLVSERDSGRILELDDGGPREVGVVDDVAPRGEAGLLGIAVSDGYLYAYATTDADNRIVRFPVEGEEGELALGREQTVLSGIPSASHHDGGRLAFGPDGMLYATAGDAGNTANAQDLDSLGGKILRIAPDGGVPDDNPFAGSYVYSYGHRNPQGIVWDEDGTMYASEFGQDTWDELNVIEAGGDYGWPEVEGIAGDERFLDPVQQWEPDEASPSGIAIADGSLWIANLAGQRLREVPLDDLSSSSEHLAGEHGRLRDVVAAPDGSLWVVTNNTDGRGDPSSDDDRILRFAPPPDPR